MSSSDIKQKLLNFFRGEETREGRRLIDQWYHSFDDKADRLADYTEWEKEELRGDIWEDIEATTGRPEEHKPFSVHHYSSERNFWTAKIAAAFIIMLFAVLPALYYQGVFTSDQKNVEYIEYRTVSNSTGQMSQVMLADGSKVWLSAASTLRYPETFGDSLRMVNLHGEAFFDVSHNPDQPFIVNSGQLRTKVLGTSFNIRGFEDEQDIQVTVASGRVSVEEHAASAGKQGKGDKHIAVLAANQQLVFEKKISKGVTQTVNPRLYTSWKDGKLTFVNHSFEEIARQLERWYGVQIYFSDASLKEIRFKIDFENNSLKHALQMLQAIEDFKFKMEENQVWIKAQS